MRRDGFVFANLLKSAKQLYRLSGPISRDSAILSLRYPVLRDTFSGRLAAPKNGAIPPPWYFYLHQTYLCDTPFCNISRDNCAIPHKNKHKIVFAILSLQVSRDMKSIAAGPLSNYCCSASPEIDLVGRCTARRLSHLRNFLPLDR